MLKVGQVLWYVDPKKGTEGSVEVTAVYENKFSVLYHGKTVERGYEVIGKKLFLAPKEQRLRETQVQPQAYPKNVQSRASGNKKVRSQEHDRRAGPLTLETKQPAFTKVGKQPPEAPTLSESAAMHAGILPVQESPREKKCSNCRLQRSGECSSLAGVVCEDYRAIQEISAVEKDAWPDYGDATTFRINNSHRYIKKVKY